MSHPPKPPVGMRFLAVSPALARAAVAVGALASFSACTPAANPPEPATSKTVPQPTPPLVLPPFQMDTSATPDAVPPFETPQITWGPTPEGTSHAERTRTYDLQHQVVTVRFDWPTEAVIGSTTLRIGALSGAPPTSDIAIDARDMTIRRVTSGDSPLRYDYDNRTLTVHLPTALRDSQQVSITIDYQGEHRTSGAYFKERKHVVFTQGETEATRFWVPTYDYPNDKTTWEFFIWTAKGERALSNGRLAGSRQAGDSIEWHWIQDKPASTYLMTTVIGNYTVLQDTPWKGVPIGYWTYPDSIEAARRGFARTPKAVDVYSRKTGVSYPWAKYDQIVIPDFQFGGMENVTATSQNDTEILHPASSEPQASSVPLMAHELGHQWFGDFVTARDWANIWLNEGFATFMEQIFREEDLGKDEGAYNRLGAQETAIAADARARRPLVYDRWANDPFELFFTGHIYQKGAAVLQMLRHQVGDEVFWRAINRYLTSHAYGPVGSDDLRTAFEETTGKDFKQFFQQWVYGSGFPVFQVSSLYDRAAGRVVVTAREIQPRDSMTGFFDVDADVEVRTDSGVVRFVVPVRNGSGEAGTNVKAPPRSVRWDKGGWILDITDFPRSTRMLQYQLISDDDVLGRIEAVDALGARQADQSALNSLIGATRNDKFWAVRARAAGELGAWSSEPSRAGIPAMRSVKTALLAATRDPDARVREAAARALGGIATGATVPLDVATRLRELARRDTSLLVRGEALAADIRLEKAAAVPFARELMAPEVWANINRTAAVTALKAIDTPEARALLDKYATPRQ